jgi:hypothetical protein
MSESEARKKFYTLTGPAIGAGKIAFDAVNALTQLANGSGWNDALTALQAELEKAQ